MEDTYLRNSKIPLLEELGRDMILLCQILNYCIFMQIKPLLITIALSIFGRS